MVQGAFWGPYYSRDRGQRIVTTTEDTIMPVEVEQSTGFHVIEIHAPSVGVSSFAIVCALIAVGLAYGCYKRCCAMRLFPAQPQAMPLPPPYTQSLAPAAPPAYDTVQPLLQVMALQHALQNPSAQLSRIPSRYETSRIYTLPEEPTVTATAVQPSPTNAEEACATTPPLSRSARRMAQL